MPNHDAPLSPLARALLDAAASVEDEGDVPLRELMDQTVQTSDGDALLDDTIRRAPNMTLAQRLDIGAWLMASQRTFATSVGDITHLVFAVPVLLRVTEPWSPHCLDPARTTGLRHLEDGLREHGLVRPETVLWTLPYVYSLPDLLAFTPTHWRRMNTAAFRRLKAVRQHGWAPFDLNDPVWGVPPSPVERPDASDEHLDALMAELLVSDGEREVEEDVRSASVATVPGTVPASRVELRFMIGGALDHRENALALWEDPDPSDPDLVAGWVDTLDFWAQDAIREIERATGQTVLQVLPPGPLTVARDGGVFAWHEFLFRGALLNAKDQVSDVPLYATLHQVDAINSGLGAASAWQDLSALAIELRRQDNDELIDTFAWPHTGLGDDQEWMVAIVRTLTELALLRADDGQPATAD